MRIAALTIQTEAVIQKATVVQPKAKSAGSGATRAEIENASAPVESVTSGGIPSMVGDLEPPLADYMD